MNSDILNQSIEFIKGIGPSRSKLLSEELNLKTIKDLIDFYPYRYIDRSKFFKINELPTIFVNRKRGHSSVNFKLIIQSLIGILKLYFIKISNQE